MLLCLMCSCMVSASQVYNVRNYGAKGDGKSLDHKSINKAIETCAMNGGGRPKVGPIVLNRQLLSAFWYEGKLYEFNFSKMSDVNMAFTTTHSTCEKIQANDSFATNLTYGS